VQPAFWLKNFRSLEQLYAGPMTEALQVDDAAKRLPWRCRFAKTGAELVFVPAI
jgi:hypothetical protein